MMTFHESYGDVSVAQLRAYRKFNVSPSDHQELVSHYGTHPGACALITKVVKDEAFHSGNSFSTYLWRKKFAGWLS